jgi:hypothetical protein
VLFSNGKDSLIGLPDKSVEFDNYLSGKWRNGSMRQYGNQGITASFDYPYMYPSASDEDVDEWSEESVANSPGRRQILAVIETKDLAQGNYIKFDYVIGFGFVESQSALSLVLNKSSTEARDQYFNFSSLEPELTKNVLIYPNPSTGRFMIRGISAGLYEIYVTDIQGVRLIGEQIQVLGDYECNFYLSSGVYTVELIGSSGIITKTLIIQP